MPHLTCETVQCSHLFNRITVLLSLVLLAHCLPSKQGHTTNLLRSTTAIEYCLVQSLQNVGAVRAAIKLRKKCVYRNSSRKKLWLSSLANKGTQEIHKETFPLYNSAQDWLHEPLWPPGPKTFQLSLLTHSPFMLMQKKWVCHDGR